MVDLDSSFDDVPADRCSVFNELKKENFKR